MTDTPRTDAATHILKPGHTIVVQPPTVNAAFAQGLERELNQARERIGEYSAYVKRMEAQQLSKAHAGEILYRVLKWGEAIPETAVVFDDTGTPFSAATFCPGLVGTAYEPDGEHHDRWIMEPVTGEVDRERAAKLEGVLRDVLHWFPWMAASDDMPDSVGKAAREALAAGGGE